MSDRKKDNHVIDLLSVHFFSARLRISKVDYANKEKVQQ